MAREKYLWPGRRGPLASKPIRPPIPYYGGKARSRRWIIAHMPHHEVYVEPFFGAGSVLLAKQRCRIETVNDLDGSIVAMWKVLRDRIFELVSVLAATEFSRAVVREAALACESGDELRAAWGRIVKGCLSFSGVQDGTPGFEVAVQAREDAAAEYTNKRRDGVSDLTVRLRGFVEVSERLRDVQIEHMDGVDVVRRYGVREAVIYCDPPYLWESQAGNRRFEQDFSSREDHERLLDALLSVPSAVLLSGYRSELYERELEGRGWVRVDRSATVTLSANGEAGKRQEALWLNPECVRRVEKELTSGLLFT